MNIQTLNSINYYVRTLLENNIFIVLGYATEVYNDVLQQIKYYVQSKTYCLQDYMNPSILPTLNELYDNYKKNEANVL